MTAYKLISQEYGQPPHSFQMDQEEHQRSAIQSFKEFTGNENEEDARRILMKCEWDVQRAINIYFMRGSQLGMAADEPEEMVERIVHQPATVRQRISHFNNRNELITARTWQQSSQSQTNGNEAADDSVQLVEDTSGDVQMLEEGVSRQNGGEAAASIRAGEHSEIRAPIPAVRGVMLAQSFSETYQNGRSANSVFFHPNEGRDVASASASSTTTQPDFRQMQDAHRTAMDRFHQPKKSASRGEGEGSSSTDAMIAEAVGGFGQGVKRDLRILFRPPSDLTFHGEWDQALQIARQKNVWLLVNVQNSQEFSSAVLNRDIWSAEMVKEVIRTNFLFLQVYHDSGNGVRLRGYYGFETFPVIFIVDPRTGEEVQKLQALDVATFLEDLTNFLARYPTFEARDQEFREMVAQGRLVPARQSMSASNSTDSQRSAQATTTSPVSKKRKQPGLRSGSSSGGEVEDDDQREANLQAKKMKRVVTIADADMQPSTSVTTIWPTTTAVEPVIDPEEWRKWIADTSQLDIPRVQFQFRLPDGRKHRVQLWAQAPLSALFSLVASLGLSASDHLLVLDFPRREYALNTAEELLSLSLRTLSFGPQELVNVEKRVVAKGKQQKAN